MPKYVPSGDFSRCTTDALHRSETVAVPQNGSPPRPAEEYTPFAAAGPNLKPMFRSSAAGLLADPPRQQPPGVDLRKPCADALHEQGRQRPVVEQDEVEQLGVGHPDLTGEKFGVKPRGADHEPEPFAGVAVIVGVGASGFVFHRANFWMTRP